MSIYRIKKLPIHIKHNIWLVIVGLFLAGCTFTDTYSLAPEHETFALYGSQTIGQTVVCHHAGLASVEVLLQAHSDSSAIVLHLLDNENSPTDIATVTLSPQTDALSFHRFDFPIQDDVNGATFFIRLESPETSPEHAIRIPYNRSDSADQVLSLNRTQAPGQLSLKLDYNSFYIVKDLGRRAFASGLKTTWLLFLSALLYLLPGGAAVAWLIPEGGRIERLILSTGSSVAFNALLMYATMTGLRLNKVVVIGYLVLCAALIVAKWATAGRQIKLNVPTFRSIRDAAQQNPAAVALLAIFGLVLGVRLFVVRDLIAPMWGDSYQHTMISQLMIDNGGLFDSWEPLAPIATFTYHFGFHANVAFYHWLSGDAMLHSVIWNGQILNALAVLGLYPLATKLSGGNRWSGVVAVLVAGLLSPMPMFYFNWGRYTQLTAQVILPVVMWLTYKITRDRKLDWSASSLLALLVAGLGITHYRVILIYGLFVIAWGAILVIRDWGRWRQIGRAILHLALVGGLTLLIFMPWGIHISRSRITQISQNLISQDNQNEFHSKEYNAIGDVSQYVPWGLLIAALASLVWQSTKKQIGGWIMLLWVGGLFLLSNPYVVHLPGTGIVNNFTVLIMLYIPAGILVGVSLGEIVDRLWRWPKRSGLALLTAAIVVSSGWGTIQRTKDINLAYAFVTAQDVKAMAWIRENTTPDAKFLVNGFIAYGGTSAVGADAGWWVPLLTNRSSTLPPLSYGLEMPVYHDGLLKPRQVVNKIRETSPVSEETMQFLADEGVTHVYIGQKNGTVGNPGQPLLDGDELVTSSHYKLVYHQDDVWILELDYR